MRNRKLAVAAAAGLVAAVALAGCGAPAEDNPATGAPSSANSASASSDPATAAPRSSEVSSEDGVVGTQVRFTAGDVVVEVVIEKDNPTTRSFLAMLPMTLEFSDYGGKEKVAIPTGEWDFTDAEGLEPEIGDLFSYKPWGNLGFFYNTEGNTFSNDLTKIGATKDIDQIELLDGQQVTIAVANRERDPRE
ncbi:cyclophilin-like fold protein [Demetria terragena]|uniref:cyclophilin-like fold protein n=1 Tax=Demetria terragena TaxID=63959 RepID=UPI0003690294|nr:cyclophilin-like fold protein [Demetria terragena]